MTIGPNHPDYNSPIPLLDPTVNDLWYNPYTGPPLLGNADNGEVIPGGGFGYGAFGQGGFGG